MKKWNKIIRGILLTVFIFGFSLPVLAAGEYQVYDEANLLTESERTELKQVAGQLNEQYQMNFILLTIDDAEGKEAMEYADDFYMDQGFYDNDAKGGTVVLIDMDNRELWISTAGDMVYYLTDQRIEAVMDAGYDDLTEGNYYSSFAEMLNQIETYLERGIPANQYTYDSETGKIIRYRSIQPIEAVIAVLIALAAAGGASVWVIGSYRMRWGTYKYPYQEKSSLYLQINSDRFVNQTITHRRIPKNPPPSGGGGGGGGGRSTIHHSGGGGSFGGGGRKF